MTDNKEIPQDVKDAIEDGWQKQTELWTTKDHKTYSLGFTDGYLLSQQALEEKEKEIKKLKRSIEALEMCCNVLETGLPKSINPTIHDSNI
jgi:hypothetical protein